MENEKCKTIRVLVVEPGKHPYLKEAENTLTALQKEVGGYIQAVYPFDDPVGLICNEEGKLMNLPLNRALRMEDGEVYDIIAGTFLVAGLGEEDFESLTDALAEKYEERFHSPETFLWIDGHVHVIECVPEIE